MPTNKIAIVGKGTAGSISAMHFSAWSNYDIELLSQKASQFSGAEIEESIIEAMHLAFSENREFVTQDIINAIQEFVPLAYTNKEKLEILEEWAITGKVRLAS